MYDGISLFHVAVVLVVFYAIVKALFGKSKNRKNDNEKKKENIVGHTLTETAVKVETRHAEAHKRERQGPMATPVAPKLDPVFLQKTDWSEYDEPAFIRAQKAKEEAERKKKEERSAKAAQRQTRSSSDNRRRTPDKQVGELEQHVRGQQGKPTYQEI